MKLRTVILPETIQRIGKLAFTYAEKLEYINIPRELKYLGSTAFAYCRSLKLSPLRVPEGLTVIPNFCFFDCGGVSNVIIPESVVEIGNSAFMGTGLTSIKIHPAVEKVGEMAFADCPITEAHIDNSNMDAWRESVFTSNYELEVMTITGNPTAIPSFFVTDCRYLRSVSLPETIEEIRQYAFSQCSSLTEINYPAALKRIEKFAFKNVEVRNVSLPASLEYLGSGCFSSLRDPATLSCEAVVPPV